MSKKLFENWNCARFFRVLTVFFALVVNTKAAEVVADSGGRQVALVELFTSEGCSSCPPAEAQLSELVRSPKLWRELVPVAFHVDYWDNLGWKDRFSSPVFTARQRSYAAVWKVSTIYTPCFVVNGEEWRSNLVTAIGQDAGRSERGHLRVERDGRKLHLSYQASPDFMGGKATVVLLGVGIETGIRRGENAGRTLKHDFVALAIREVDLTRDASGKWIADADLPKSGEGRCAIAAWISTIGTLRPLQAVGGWLN